MTAGRVVEASHWTNTGSTTEDPSVFGVGTVNEPLPVTWSQFQRLGQVRSRLGTHVAAERTGESLLDTWWKVLAGNTTQLVVVLPSVQRGHHLQQKEGEVEVRAAPSDQARRFAELLDDVCIKARLTREQAGQLLGAKRRTVQSWVSGQRVPRPEAQERLDRLRTVLEPVFSWTTADVQRWMHTGGPSGFDLLQQGDYSAFRERIAEANSRRRVVSAEVRHVAGPQVRPAGDETLVGDVTLAPKDLLNDWLRDTRRQAHLPRRRSSDWFPEGYESAPGPEQDE